MSYIYFFKLTLYRASSPSKLWPRRPSRTKTYNQNPPSLLLSPPPPISSPSPQHLSPPTLHSEPHDGPLKCLPAFSKGRSRQKIGPPLQPQQLSCFPPQSQFSGLWTMALQSLWAEVDLPEEPQSGGSYRWTRKKSQLGLLGNDLYCNNSYLCCFVENIIVARCRDAISNLRFRVRVAPTTSNLPSTLSLTSIRWIFLSAAREVIITKCTWWVLWFPEGVGGWGGWPIVKYFPRLYNFLAVVMIALATHGKISSIDFTCTWGHRWRLANLTQTCWK